MTKPPPSAVRAMSGSLLLVDDEVALLRGLVRWLSLAAPQWRITTARSAELALELLAKEAFDVVVTDLEMPGIGGLELLEQASSLYPELVRVVHSSHRNERAEALADFVLGKPVPSEVFLATVDEAFAEAFERSRPRTALESQAG